MLSYLAAALPANTSAAARLIALQCALRMNRSRQVQLPKGLLRSMRLDTHRPWHELQQARWLHLLPERTANEAAAELLDVTLLEQAPARPDRRCAAQWALRASSRARANGALPQLASLYLAAHTSAEEGTGHSEADTMARACGTDPATLPHVLMSLAATGLLRSWRACQDSGDLHWTWRDDDELGMRTAPPEPPPGN
ncbi:MULTISPECIES: hypothetical protein [unclassified Streptomyces]|uniref:hypothetical protein n=1 Tax=unclassified Streptomyces TaxID=2593676 RepID=UPI00096512BF|nr:hypothetical protein [Streptomyces sp. TSRI0107]OKJ70191.1 hypothetical protein AMK31_37040 [Streptomyces sp. TSRI0107]